MADNRPPVCWLCVDPEHVTTLIATLRRDAQALRLATILFHNKMPDTDIIQALDEHTNPDSATMKAVRVLEADLRRMP